MVDSQTILEIILNIKYLFFQIIKPIQLKHHQPR